MVSFENIHRAFSLDVFKIRYSIDAELEKKHSLIDTKIDNLHDDLMHEVNILDAKIDDTTETCMIYRNKDRNEMEDLRQDVAILETLINQCLERTR